jgi:pantoate--beta-alanine ligase
MKIVSSPKRMHLVSRGLKDRHQTIGFVATMGALHLGHSRLIRRARQGNDIVVVSIFVNPKQFAPKEDFRCYPRTLKQDYLLCKKEGVDIIFVPTPELIYPFGYKTYVCVEGLSDTLCGEFRKGHFRGVATVVTKLFNIVSPDIAYFGQKDAQQAIIIKKMARDLNMPVIVKIVPTERNSAGLALSSRNAYLSNDECKDALILFQALSLAKDLVRKGSRDAAGIIRKMRQFILKKKSAKIEYISVVDQAQLLSVKRIIDGCLVVLAVRIGKTRLIDNIIVRL